MKNLPEARPGVRLGQFGVARRRCSRCAAVAHTWNGDGDGVDELTQTLGASWPSFHLDLRIRRAVPLGSASVTDPVPQAGARPVDAAAIFLVATIDDGGEQTVHDALPDIVGIGPRHRISRPVQEAVGGHRDRLGRLGPVVRRAPPGRAASVHRAGRAACITPRPPPEICCSTSAPRRMDVCFELAGRLMEAMDGAVTVVDEVHGFNYFDNRDLLGFVDGTENPNGPGGVERHRHRRRGSRLRRRLLRAHPAVRARHVGRGVRCPSTSSRTVIGRTKFDDIELDDDVKPAEFARRAERHHRCGRQRAEDRARATCRTAASATASTAPTSSATRARPGSPSRCWPTCSSATRPGNTDRILDFSTAVTGGMFFVPTVDFLDDPPPLPGYRRAGRPKRSGARPAPWRSAV